MQQRVNLARALAADPVVLLMDEPFAALDAQTREFMQAELLKIWTQAKKTVLFITHQINEAVYLADRVIVMSARPGRVKGIFDIPFDRPRSLRLKRDPRFLELEDAIWKLIEEEAGRLGMMAGDSESANGKKVDASYPGSGLYGEYAPDARAAGEVVTAMIKQQSFYQRHEGLFSAAPRFCLSWPCGSTSGSKVGLSAFFQRPFGDCETVLVSAYRRNVVGGHPVQRKEFHRRSVAGDAGRSRPRCDHRVVS